LEHLGNERGVGLERLAHGIERQLEEVDRLGLVGNRNDARSMVAVTSASLMPGADNLNQPRRT
jgi:hypothetical protein